MGSQILSLKDGSRIAVVGGGPAGSLFAVFALQLARDSGLDLEVTVYDGKPFGQPGPSGCNMCAGVIAAGLVRKLEKLGILLPDRLIQRNIGAYTLETASSRLRLESPSPGDRIYTVYRGNGPRGTAAVGRISFDDYLLEVAEERGARIVRRPVQDIRLPDRSRDPASILVATDSLASPEPREAELLVCAFGLNSRLAARLGELGFGYRPPATIRTFQAELRFPREYIEDVFRDSIFIYDLDLPGVKFSAAVPKGDYVTVTLVGEGAGESSFQAFLSHPAVSRSLPPAWQLPARYCHCRPAVSVSPASRPFTDRLVVIGDASHSRLYKNGLESAYVTAQSAAKSAIYRGVSRDDFAAGYLPVCQAITKDSRSGRAIFWAINLPVARQALSTFVYPAAAEEQARSPAGKRPTSAILWSIFTGDQPYRSILRRMLNPLWILSLLWGAIRRKVNALF